MRTGTATFRREEAAAVESLAQYGDDDELVFADVLLLAVIEVAPFGDVLMFGDVGELSLIAFSLACRLHL